MRRLPVLAALALVLVAPAAHAGLIGAEFDAAYYYQVASPPYSGANWQNPTFTVVDPGVETLLNIEQTTYMSVDFTDSKLTIHYDRTTANSPTWGNSVPNGPVFTLAPTSPLTSLGIIGFTTTGTTLAGFTASNVTITDQQIIINWGGLTYAAGDDVVLNFAFVPEPSSIIALGAGCVALPLLARRRRRSAA